MKWKWIQHMSSALKVGEFLFQNLGENTQNHEGTQNPCTQYVLNFYFIFYQLCTEEKESKPQSVT